MQVTIVDYGLGNLRSVAHAFAHLGAEPHVTQDAGDLERARVLVLPGVGAFGDGKDGLARRGLVEPLRAAVAAGKPLLGICLGLQLLFERSAEAPGVAGLGLLAGEVARFDGEGFGKGGGLKVPQIGWNQVIFTRRHPVFADVADGAYLYFVHSYYVKPASAENVLAVANYGGLFCAAAGRDRVAGVQFHPEKSQAVGLKILGNFLAWAQAT